MRPNPLSRTWILLGVLALVASTYLVVKRDAISRFVIGTVKMPGHPKPLRVVAAPAAKGMIVA